MANIPNTEYITVNANGIFVGGKPATTYRGEDICGMQDVKNIFAWMQEQNPEIEEFHIGAFETRGEYAKLGNPSGKHGPNAWCQVKFKNGKLGAWVFDDTFGSAADCAGNCALDCAHYVQNYASFRSAVLFDLVDKQYKKTENYPIQNTVVLCDKNGNYHVAFDSKIGREEFSGTRAEVLQQMTLRVKRILHVR